MPPAGALAADFLGVLEAEELAAGAIGAEVLAAGAEAADGAEAVVGVAEDFWLLVFAAGLAGALAAGEEAAGCIASALADFLLLLLFLLVVASDAPAAVAGAADVALESELDDLLLLFFSVILSDEPALLAEVEDWSAASVVDFLWLDFDLLELKEVVLESGLAAASDFALFLDFVLDDLLSLAATVWSSVVAVLFFDFFLLLLADVVAWSSCEPLWVCATTGAITSPNSRHTPTLQISTLNRSVLIPDPLLDVCVWPDSGFPRPFSIPTA